MGIPFFGELLSFLCAIVWAVAIIFFRESGEHTSPFSLNLYKNTIATSLFFITSFILGQSIIIPIHFSQAIAIFFSGALGVALSDTLYFHSLNILGAGLSSVVNCAYSPIMIFLSFFFLGERLSLIQLMGAALIVTGILLSSLVLKRKQLSSKKLFIGIILGVASVTSMALSIIIIKPFLHAVPILWFTEFRLLSGAIVLWILLLFRKDKHKIITVFRPVPYWKYQLPGVFLGAYFAMILWLGGIKYTHASIATAINQTSIIFVLIFAGIFLKEGFSLRRICAALIAFSGVILITFCG